MNKNYFNFILKIYTKSTQKRQFFNFKILYIRVREFKRTGKNKMRKDGFITVREYVEDLKVNGYDNNGPMMSAQDYAKSLREQCDKYQSQSLITVEDYVKSLDGRRYQTPVELDIESQVEKSLTSKKAELNAKIVEDLLA